jgi:hypothetical protein
MDLKLFKIKALERQPDKWYVVIEPCDGAIVRLLVHKLPSGLGIGMPVVEPGEQSGRFYFAGIGPTIEAALEDAAKCLAEGIAEARSR